MKKDKLNTNRKIDMVERRSMLRCSLCPPNKGENGTRQPKYGTKKPKYKDHRR